ncbi:MAG: hypothetical protein ABWY16_04030 [Pedobacter sp.]|uniref:hypothetical protein n=1 Tax=Pedobacter sp. TaxID=1411316 RepID=UPI0033985C17
MKSLTFCFDHPVAVKVFFSCISDPGLKHDIQFLRSTEDGSLVIPVTDMAGGSWKVMLEWTYEGRDFCMERTFDVVPGAILS